jgi:hypothetical protein
MTDPRRPGLVSRLAWGAIGIVWRPIHGVLKRSHLAELERRHAPDCDCPTCEGARFEAYDRRKRDR